MSKFEPTCEQRVIINDNGSAFISACPGAGKTRCIVERVRHVFTNSLEFGALAFLSFTNTAVDELRSRFAGEQLLPDPIFPHFVGTFDSFIWHYLVAPFGISGVDDALKLIPDKDELIVQPYPKARPLTLGCFDRHSGKIIPEKATNVGFKGDPKSHETAAIGIRERLLQSGQLDFDDVRVIASSNLLDDKFSDKLARILRSRFGEIIVDEAQDCNAEDLKIVDWLRNKAEISVKIVCDPHQSIYGFRGGVSDELFKYSETFGKKKRLPLTGNFRSSGNICKAVHMLRAPDYRGDADEAVGEYKDVSTSVFVIGYKGALTDTIGKEFAKLISDENIELNSCRLVSKTRNSGSNAIGVSTEKAGQALGKRLALASMVYYQSTLAKSRRDALIEVHKVALSLSGQLNGRSYHQAVSEDEIEPLSWRGDMINILKQLEFDADQGHTRSEWVGRARVCLKPYLGENCGSIAQNIPDTKALDNILSVRPIFGLSRRTIHEVKGQEYLGICAVMTSKTAKGILDFLQGEDNGKDESAREIYVAASRAERLLAIACPKSQSSRLVKHLSQSGASVELIKTWD